MQRVQSRGQPARSSRLLRHTQRIIDSAPENETSLVANAGKSFQPQQTVLAHANLRHRVAAINLRRLITLGLDNIDGAWIIPATT